LTTLTPRTSTASASGATGAETPEHWQARRRYVVPGRLVRAGRNVIAVRVWDQTGGGGITGPASELYLEEKLPPNVQTVAPPALIRLAGDWRYKIENTRPGDPGAPPSALNQNAAAGLYNGMIAPLLPYTIKGAIWYQGESNAGNAAGYRTLFPAMIRNWRRDWNMSANRDFPFLLVQLAPFMAIKDQPAESGWAALREAQLHATRVLPNVGMAVITDVGHETDIHPRKKQPVGERLALLARKIAYGDRRLVASGPTLRSMTVRGNEAVLRFRQRRVRA
jgi:sialate O-acetylesterase